MTLFKQIALALSLLLITILTTVLVINFQSANKSVQERLYEDAKNTASSLSLSLGTAQGDLSVMSTMINANFDSGTYHYISLVDVDDEILYERKSEVQQLDVPQWFLNMFDIEAPLASANVSAGWSQVGLLNVQSDVSYAYTQLYTISKNLLILFGIISAVGLLLLNLLLAAILKPLKEVQRQAEAVIQNEFILQEKIPYTKEFKDVVLGMNNMVSKVKSMFDKANEELKRQKEKEYIDPTTKLKNRKYLIDKLPQYLKIDANYKTGVSIMIAFSGMIEANEKIGHKKVDTLYKNLADMFLDESKSFKEAIVSRMNGTEFALFLPNATDEKSLILANTILERSKKMIREEELQEDKTFLSIGLYEYNHKESISSLLAQSDTALAQAKLQKENIYLINADEITEVMGKEAWRDVIVDAIKNNKFEFISWLVVDSKAKQIAHHVLSIRLVANKETTYSYAQFMAIANQIGMSNDIYSSVLQQLFKNPDASLKNTTCSLRLPYDFLLLSTSYDELSKLIKKYMHKLPFKLIIEMPDKLVNSNSELINDYKMLFDKYGVDMGIFEFIGDCADYNYLQDMRPVYIKAESDYFLSQNEQSLNALKQITDTIDISLIATSVMSEETLKDLQRKEIDIIQGRATELISL